MNNSVKIKMLKKINKASKGKLFLLSDFDKLGTYDSIRTNLKLLTREGYLQKVYPGIYQKTLINEKYNLLVPADTREVAYAIAKKNKWKIAPDINWSLNILGLDTQVPNDYEFISNGPTRKIELENGQKILYRKLSQRRMDMNPTSAMTFEAIYHIGEKNFNQEILTQISKKLSKEQFEQLKKDSKQAKQWVSKKINQIESNTHD